MTEDLKPLSKKHQRVLDNYVTYWRQTDAYWEVYPKNSYESAKTSAARLFANANFSAHLQARLDELQMSADEALKIQTDIGRGDVGIFFKVVDEWMFNPLPEYEILAEQEVDYEKEDGTKEKRVSYRVRHVVLDMDKVIDPKYSHLIQEFSNSRRRGLSIKTYSKYEAVRDILKIRGKLKPDTYEVVVRYADPNDKPA